MSNELIKSIIEYSSESGDINFDTEQYSAKELSDIYFEIYQVYKNLNSALSKIGLEIRNKK